MLQPDAVHRGPATKYTVKQNVLKAVHILSPEAVKKNSCDDFTKFIKSKTAGLRYLYICTCGGIPRACELDYSGK